MLIKPEEISGIIKKKIDNYESKMKVDEVGYVVQSSDGVAKVYGLENCMSGELVDFGNDIFGMALNLEEECFTRWRKRSKRRFFSKKNW